MIPPTMTSLDIGIYRVYQEGVFQVTGLAVHTETGERFAVYSPTSLVDLSPNNCVLRPLELANDDASAANVGTVISSETDLPLGRYEHFKSTPENPKFYEVTGIGENTETLERLVVYRPLYQVDLGPNTCLVRSVEMFLEDVTRDGVTKQRFKFVGN